MLGPRRKHLNDLRLLDGWPSRARYVLHRLFVPNPKDWAMLELPSWLAPLYWVLRPFRLARAALSRRDPSPPPVP